MTSPALSEIDRFTLSLLRAGVPLHEREEIIKEWREGSDVLRVHCECCENVLARCAADIRCASCAERAVPWPNDTRGGPSILS
jgi:ribosomal protein S27E